MYTNFDASFRRILELFKSGRILDDDKLYDILGDVVLGLSLGGATLPEFLMAVTTDGYLEWKDRGNGYKITTKGRNRLKQLNKKAAGYTSSQAELRALAGARR